MVLVQNGWFRAVPLNGMRHRHQVPFAFINHHHLVARHSLLVRTSKSVLPLNVIPLCCSQAAVVLGILRNFLQFAICSILICSCSPLHTVRTQCARFPAAFEDPIGAGWQASKRTYVSKCLNFTAGSLTGICSNQSSICLIPADARSNKTLQNANQSS